MTEGAATESKLGQLHSKVADIMLNALDVTENAQKVYQQVSEQIIDNPDDVELIAKLPSKVPEVSSALLGVITKFLSDNSVTCVREEGEGESDLARKLRESKARRRVGNVVALHSED